MWYNNNRKDPFALSELYTQAIVLALLILEALGCSRILFNRILKITGSDLLILINKKAI